MRQLENVDDTLVSSYFSSKDVVLEKFSSDLSSENPYWDSDRSVASLSDICIKMLVRCFSRKPIVSHGLRGHNKQLLMSQLGVTEDLVTCYHWLEDGLYWRRRCEALYPGSDVSQHGLSWKRMCIEQTIKFNMEKFQPGKSDMADLKQLSEAVGKIVEQLELAQLLSPTIMVPAGQGLTGKPETVVSSRSTTPLSGVSRSTTPESGPKLPDEIDMLTPANHLDFSVILPLFPNLDKLILCFQTKRCGVDFRWSMFGLTEKDADNIANGISHCHKLSQLSIRNSRLTDTLLYDVMGGMDKLGNITTLHFPNNILTDECIDVFTRAVGNKKIKNLNLSNNKIANEGIKNLAIFIANGKSSLEILNLSLNLVEDDGAVTLLKAVSLDKLICDLNISSNRLSVESSGAVRDLLKLNRQITKLDLSCNNLTLDGGNMILEGLKYNTSIKYLDVR